MAEGKISMEEFKERVVEAMISTYAKGYDEEYIREAVEDEEYASILKDGYDYEYGIEHGIRYAADNIGMCI